MQLVYGEVVAVRELVPRCPLPASTTTDNCRDSMSLWCAICVCVCVATAFPHHIVPRYALDWNWWPLIINKHTPTDGNKNLSLLSEIFTLLYTV